MFINGKFVNVLALLWTDENLIEKVRNDYMQKTGEKIPEFGWDKDWDGVIEAHFISNFDQFIY